MQPCPSKREWSWKRRMTLEVISLIYLCVNSSFTQRWRVEQVAPSVVHWEAVQINHCVCAWRRCCKAAHLHLNAAGSSLCAWKIIFQCDYLKPVEAMLLCAEIASYTICIIYGCHLHYSASHREERKQPNVPPRGVELAACVCSEVRTVFDSI